jgi:hypothetical protein
MEKKLPRRRPRRPGTAQGPDRGVMFRQEHAIRMTCFISDHAERIMGTAQHLGNSARIFSENY